LAARARGLQALIEFKRAIGSEVMSELDQQYKDAAQASLEQRYDEALSGFLAIVERDRLYRNDAARRSMLALFDLLGNDNPLTNVYRKKLMTAIY
jgi:putative thioredoxin